MPVPPFPVYSWVQKCMTLSFCSLMGIIVWLHYSQYSQGLVLSIFNFVHPISGVRLLTNTNSLFIFIPHPTQDLTRSNFLPFSFILSNFSCPSIHLHFLPSVISSCLSSFIFPFLHSLPPLRLELRYYAKCTSY